MARKARGLPRTSKVAGPARTRVLVFQTWGARSAMASLPIPRRTGLFPAGPPTLRFVVLAPPASPAAFPAASFPAKPRVE
jgi:hypothetical protein